MAATSVSPTHKHGHTQSHVSDLSRSPVDPVVGESERVREKSIDKNTLSRVKLSLRTITPTEGVSRLRREQRKRKNVRVSARARVCVLACVSAERKSV